MWTKEVKEKADKKQQGLLQVSVNIGHESSPWSPWDILLIYSLSIPLDI